MFYTSTHQRYSVSKTPHYIRICHEILVVLLTLLALFVLSMFPVIILFPGGVFCMMYGVIALTTAILLVSIITLILSKVLEQKQVLSTTES
ncbi:hypothetical protein [Candidatus Chlamydia sanziniae]|nr:hypothetical protein [Candidatus Chlamydia sanziniae]